MKTLKVAFAAACSFGAFVGIAAAMPKIDAPAVAPPSLEHVQNRPKYGCGFGSTSVRYCKRWGPTWKNYKPVCSEWGYRCT